MVLEMNKIILTLLLMATTGYSQGVINMQSGSGVPTDMVVGALLGGLVAPMISKGPDARLVGGLLGAVAGGAYGTAQQQQQQQQSAYQHQLQQEQMRQWHMQQQQMMAWQQQQMAQYSTASGAYGRDSRMIKVGIKQGEYVKSPYSKYRFHLTSQDIHSGDTLYDPETGQPFRVP